MKINTKKFILILLIIPFLGIINLNGQNLSDNGAFDVLIKWEGKWKNEAVFEKSILTPKRTETRGTTESKFILSNKYLEIMVYNNSVSKHLLAYDQKSNQFNRWEFNSDGNNNFWIGKWNKNNNTMKWDYIDFSGNGIIGEIIERFESDNKIKTKVTMKDKSGNILLNINSKKEKI